MLKETPETETPRARLLRVSAELFYRHGINAVGVDRVLSESKVTRATMYRHFAGKEGLVVAYLDAEDAQLRQYAALAEAQSADARQQLEIIIDAIANDAVRYHNRGCPFINAAAEFPDADSPVRSVITRHRSWFRSALVEVASAAGLREPEAIASSLVLLRDAALVGVYLDGNDSAESFRTAAHQLICST